MALEGTHYAVTGSQSSGNMAHRMMISVQIYIAYPNDKL